MKIQWTIYYSRTQSDCGDYSFKMAFKVTIHAIKYLIPNCLIFNTSIYLLLCIHYSSI